MTGVFFGRDFVSVTAAQGVDWIGLKPDVLGVMLDHFASGAPLFKPGSAADISVPAEGFDDDPEDAEIIAQIRELIDTRVRPAVARDGGDIVYRGFQQGKVFLQMQGACSGCPSSTATLKQGIEQLLKHYVARSHRGPRYLDRPERHRSRAKQGEPDGHATFRRRAGYDLPHRAHL